MILEGLVSTQNDDESTNLAPMGIITSGSMRRFTLRPFQTSRTYANLNRCRAGIFHVTDNVLMLARAAIGFCDATQELCSAKRVAGRALTSACRWYEFEVIDVDASEPRATLSARVVHQQRQRDFFGFNRAKHAVLEAAILATRTHVLPADEITHALNRLSEPVSKTGGPDEIEAFDLLTEYIQSRLGDATGTKSPS